MLVLSNTGHYLFVQMERINKSNRDETRRDETKRDETRRKIPLHVRNQYLHSFFAQEVQTSAVHRICRRRAVPCATVMHFGRRHPDLGSKASSQSHVKPHTGRWLRPQTGNEIEIWIVCFSADPRTGPHYLLQNPRGRSQLTYLPTYLPHATGGQGQRTA